MLFMLCGYLRQAFQLAGKPESDTFHPVLQHVLNVLTPYVLIDVLKPSLQFGSSAAARRTALSLPQSGTQTKGDISFLIESEKHEVGIWKPCLEIALYLIVDALKVVWGTQIGYGGSGPPGSGGNGTPSTLGFFLADDRFWHSCLRFLLSLRPLQF